MSDINGWEFMVPVGGVDTNIGVSFRNVVGSPIISAAKSQPSASHDFIPPAGIYRFTFVSATSVSMEMYGPEDVKNPIVFEGNKTVAKTESEGDDLGILPGVYMAISSDATTDDVFEIGIGCVWDSSSESWQRIVSKGFVTPGTTGDPVTIKAKNTSGFDLSECQVIVTNAIRLDESAFGTPFAKFRQIGLLNPVPDSDMIGHVFSFQNLTPGSPNTVDLLWDGVGITVVELDTETTKTDGIGLKADGSTWYYFPEGSNYQGGAFCLSDTLEVLDTATIHISDAGSMVEIATVEGDFGPGTDGLILTQDGQDSGVVMNNGTMEFRLRISPSINDNYSMNMRLFSMRAQGIAV